MSLAFLHTAAVHVATFDRWVHACAPDVGVAHHVDESLLSLAQSMGPTHPAVVARVHAAMQAAAADGAEVVVCTCSTIGDAAERVPTGGRFASQRIDRAMADRAVACGPRILLVAALPGTLQPTRALLHDSARRRGIEPVVDERVPEGAWARFLQGDAVGYVESIAACARRAWLEPAAAERAEVIVLAQASMAPAQALLVDLEVEVLSSPALGVEHALRTWAARRSARQGEPSPATGLTEPAHGH